MYCYWLACILLVFRSLYCFLAVYNYCWLALCIVVGWPFVIVVVWPDVLLLVGRL